MSNFTVKDPPEYNDELRMLEPTDPAHANLFNPLFEKLLNNEAFLKLAAEKLAQKVADHIDDETSHVTDQNKKTWNAKAGTEAATPSTAGLMSAEDKKKLNGVAENAEVNQNAFSNIVAGTVIIAANGKTTTFALEAGSNITITADNATKKIVIAANKDGGNADMLDGYHAAHFAAADHGHDGRYYTKAESDNQLKTKAAASHSHTKASITDFPASLPANGGNADTVDGKHASDLQNYNNLTNKPSIPSAYTHPTTAGNKHIPAGGASGQILRWSAAGTAVWGADNNTTYGAATQNAAGLVSITTQTFAGAKTFSGAVTMNSTVRAANNGRMVSVQYSAPSADTGMLWAW